ncbi:MAG: hypothetical protein WDM81_11500 [Rhizomicrobium sp.]
MYFGGEYDFLRPPLEFADDETIGFRGSVAFGNNLVRSLAASHALYEFACGKGELSLAEFPREVASPPMFDLMKRFLINAIVETDNG